MVWAEMMVFGGEGQEAEEKGREEGYRHDIAQRQSSRSYMSRPLAST